MSAAPVQKPRKEKPKAEVYVVRQDFKTLLGGVLLEFKNGQHLNRAGQHAQIEELLKGGAPIQPIGERSVEKCPSCGHTFDCSVDENG